jgi:transposase
MKTCRPWAPLQSYLLPPSPLDWLPEGHLAFFVLEVVEQLDLEGIEGAMSEKDPRGERPYSPRMLLALVIYGYCVGVFSSRKLARETYEDVAFRVLAGQEHPHFTTINQFRLMHRRAISGLFVQSLELCRRAGLVKLGHVALDGTKLLANASMHKAMSYQRMKDDEARLRGEVEKMLARADAVDEAEDARFGVGVAPEDLPKELQRRETRLQRLKEAKAALEQEAREARAQRLRDNVEHLNANAANALFPQSHRKVVATRAKKSAAQADLLDGGRRRRDDDDDDTPNGSATGLPTHRVKTNLDGTPKPKAQRNFTDPESRIMGKNGMYLQGYNAQVVVDDAYQVILAHGLSNQPPDQEYFAPLLQAAVANCGAAPKKVSADAGYFSIENVKVCEALGVSPYISVRRKAHDGRVRTRRVVPAQDAMRLKLESPDGRAVYARRKAIVEPVFGQMKGARGFRRLSLRGRQKAASEWGLVCLTHNLLKLFRAAWVPAGPRHLAPA